VPSGAIQAREAHVGHIEPARLVGVAFEGHAEQAAHGAAPAVAADDVGRPLSLFAHRRGQGEDDLPGGLLQRDELHCVLEPPAELRQPLAQDLLGQVLGDGEGARIGRVGRRQAAAEQVLDRDSPPFW